MKSVVGGTYLTTTTERIIDLRKARPETKSTMGKVLWKTAWICPQQVDYPKVVRTHTHGVVN